MINGINVQNNPLKYIDPRGLTTRSYQNTTNSYTPNVSLTSSYDEVLGLASASEWNGAGGQSGGMLSRLGNSVRSAVSGAADFTSKAVSAVAGVASNVAVKATAWHFEGRDAKNEPFKNYTYKDVKSHEDWARLEDWQVGTHNNKVGKIEMKYVHNITGAELVFDGDDPDKQLTKIGIKGTPNYVNPMRLQDIKGVGSALRFAARFVGHSAVDVVPFIFGGDVRGPDPD